MTYRYGRCDNCGRQEPLYLKIKKAGETESNCYQLCRICNESSQLDSVGCPAAGFTSFAICIVSFLVLALTYIIFVIASKH
jgi:hypothetical protein